MVIKSIFNPPFNSTEQEKQLLKRQAEEILNLRGGNAKPYPPRDVQTQSGARGILVTFKAPAVSDDIAGWRIYTGTESNLHSKLADRASRQIFIPAEAGASPPKMNIFVSSISYFGLESAKVQVQGSATAEAAAPAMPAVPPGFTTETAGGGDPSGGGTGRDFDKPDREVRGGL